MTTKKQKREAAAIKREKMLAAERKVGLDALEHERARRALNQQMAEDEAFYRNSQVMG